MSASWWAIFSASMAVYFGIATGSLLRWIGWLTEEADHSLLRLVVRVLYPSLIFAVVSRNADLRQASNLTWPPLAGLLTTALGFALAFLAARLSQRVNGLDGSPARRSFALCVGIYNYSYIPIPLIQAIFDQSTLGVLFVHNLGVEIVIWTLGITIVAGRLGRDWWQHLLNGPSIAIALALLVNFTRAEQFLPPFVEKGIDWLGQASVPMSLILIGAVIADEFQNRRPRRRTDGLKTVAWALVLRLLVLPVCFLTLAYLLPGTDELKRVMIVQAAMPCGTFPIVMARHYGADAGVALRVVIGTSLVSLLTIPWWIQVGLSVLGLSS